MNVSRILINVFGTNGPLLFGLKTMISFWKYSSTFFVFVFVDNKFAETPKLHFAERNAKAFSWMTEQMQIDVIRSRYGKVLRVDPTIDRRWHRL